MKIKKIDGDSAVVESGGLSKTIRVSLVRNISVGDYVIVHAGFAIEKLDQKRARETLRALKEISLR